MTLRPRQAVWVVLPGLCLPAWGQPVRGQVLAAGFGATNETGRVARPGQWIPILCDLTVQGSQHFSGELSCEMADLDGDRVAFRTGPIVLTPGAGGKRVWVYATGRGPAPQKINVISDDGATIATLDVPEVAYLSNETMLILDISARPVPRLERLQSSDAFSGELLGPRDYYRTIVVGRLPAEQLPDRWWGLEALDAIVWDKPDPGALNAAQTRALVEWVRRGGRLVVGIGETWARLRDSGVAELVPLEGGEPSATTAALSFLQPGGRFGTDRLEFDAPISVCTAKPARGATTLYAWLPGPVPLDLVVTDFVGSGRVTALATGLADLLRAPVFLSAERSRELFRHCFDLNRMHPDWIDREKEVFFAAEREAALLRPIVSPIDFLGIGQLFRFAAILFVSAYILVSTFATWWWLRRHGLTMLSWSVFAGCAVAGSALGLGTVGLTRGLARVNAVTVCDLDAGATRAAGPCWFGYRSPTRQRVDLSLPGEGNYLRALSPSRRSESSYATPQRYAAHPAAGLLEGVLLRASLKQFEGYWSGPLDGTVRAQLVVDRSSGQLAPQSWIVNDLGVDVLGGWLLYQDPRLDERDELYRLTGVETLLRRGRGGPRERTPAVAVPALPAGARNEQPLGAAEYATLASAIQRWQARTGGAADEPDLPTLRQRQTEWAGAVNVPLLPNAQDRFVAAMMLHSTRNYYLHLAPGEKALGAVLSNEGLVDHDVSHWITRDRALLVLFSARPGPAQLQRDGRSMPARSGFGVFRVRVPVARVGAAAPGERAEGER